MSSIILLNKPFHVLSQFSAADGKSTLKCLLPDYQGFYPAGRLDYDSEGLLLLTDDGRLQARISQPQHKLEKTYWVQVEGVPADADLEKLRNGILLKDGPALPARVRHIGEPADLWSREPPVRQRQSIPTAWLEIRICEGRNRQVRRMTAAAGYPTLRLIRAAIGTWTLQGLAPGEHRIESVHLPAQERPKQTRRRRART